MDSVVHNLLRSSVSDTVKFTVLQNCLSLVKNGEFCEELFKLADVVSCFLSSNCEVPEILRTELCSIIKEIFRKTPDVFLVSFFRSLACNSSVSSFKTDKALLVALFTDCDRCSAFCDQLCGYQENEINYIIVLINTLCVLFRSKLYPYIQPVVLSSRRALEAVVADLTDNITIDMILSLINCVLQFMTQTDIPTFQHEDSYIESMLDLAFACADLLIRLPSLIASPDNLLTLENSACESTNIANFIFRKVESFLADPFTINTYYLPLASLLFRLDSTNDVTSVASFVESMANRYAEHPESCLSILKRMTCWLVWPFKNESSPLDKWIIGFLCEVYKRTASYANLSQPLSELWTEFMNNQLKVTIQLLVQQNTLTMSILNTLAFLLLAGGRAARIYRYKLFNEDLFNALQCLINKESVLTSSISKKLFPRIARILQLAISSVGAIHKGCSLRDIPNPAVQFFSQFEDFVTVETLIERAKVYEWSTLLRWGSHAGDNLRRCWNRWERDLDEFNPQNAFTVGFERTNQNRVTNHGGLLNVGNTCYANATLQLLYHCPDFRLAVLENPIIKSCSGFCRPHKPGSALSRISDVSQTTCAAFADETRAELLHMQLFSLFRALNTHVGPTVRDPGKVLTLSKPAHFVNGEQQDAVEYLIHLLQRLHDEEIELGRSDDDESTPEIDGAVEETKGPTANSSDLSHAATADIATPLRDVASDVASSMSAVETTVKETDESNVTEEKLSIVSRLFGGTLVRHTSCTECAHTSSVLDEPFSCLYLPVSSPDEPVARAPNERSSAEVEDTSRTSNFDIDLTTLLRTHFSQIERVLSAQVCEACGKRTVLARRLCLKSLASHVLICLKVFTFCRESQTSSKVMKKIAIPERLCVTLSSHDSESVMEEAKLSQPFSAEVTSPSSENSTATDGSDLQDVEFPEHTTTSDSRSRSVTTRSFKLQGMILHHGLSIHCGHYTCVARVGMQWISFDDASVHLTSLDRIYATPLTTPYLLLYTQV